MQLDVSLEKKLDYFDLDLKLSCPAGRILAIVGPSGSGKSTLLRILAGLEKADHGQMSLGEEIFFDSRKNFWLPARKRKCGYLFQDYSLFPHLRLRENIAFACRRPGLVIKLMDRLGLSHLAKRKPHQLSGGERQRAALAQVLASEPRLLLLDEPFSALDINTREHLQNFLLNLKKKLRLPIILVTHDLNEACRLGDRIAAVAEGRENPLWLKRVACFHDFKTSENPLPQPAPAAVSG